jgi:hypothetical protein
LVVALAATKVAGHTSLEVKGGKVRFIRDWAP